MKFYNSAWSPEQPTMTVANSPWKPLVWCFAPSWTFWKWEASIAHCDKLTSVGGKRFQSYLFPSPFHMYIYIYIYIYIYTHTHELSFPINVSHSITMHEPEMAVWKWKPGTVANEKHSISEFDGIFCYSIWFKNRKKENNFQNNLSTVKQQTNKTKKSSPFSSPL